MQTSQSQADEFQNPLSYDEFIKKDLFKIYKRNDKSQVHTFYSKKFTNLEEKKSLISKYDFQIGRASCRERVS